MDFSTCYCPNKQCSHYGLHGFGYHLVRRGYDGDVPRLLCKMGQPTFSVRQGTAYFDLQSEERI